MYHGDFSSIGMALRIFDCTEDVIIGFFFKEEGPLWVCRDDLAEFFDDKCVGGLKIFILGGIQVFEGVEEDGMCGYNGEEAVEDGAGWFQGLDADEGVCANDCVDGIIEHEIAVDEYAAQFIEIKVPKEVCFMGPGSERVKDALYIREFGIRMFLEELCDSSIVEEGMFPALHMCL